MFILICLFCSLSLKFRILEAVVGGKLHVFDIRFHNPVLDYIILIYPPSSGYRGNSCKYKTPLSNSFVYVLIDVVSGSFRVHFDNFVAMGK